MSKTKGQKKHILSELEDKISRAKSVVFASFSGLGVKENEELRGKLKSENSEYYVAKKTLLGLAYKEKGIDSLNIKDFSGQVAVVFGYEDEVAPAKILNQFKKNNEDKINFIGGILENKYIDAERVNDLAKLPSKIELYARLVGSINAPVSGFVNSLAGNLRNFVYALKAIEEKK